MNTRISVMIAGLALCFSAVQAQICTKKESVVRFFSEAPLENIEAENRAATSLLNTATGDIAVKVPIRAFSFEKKLMQEHFNENYMESEKFPYAEFRGKISGQIDFSADGSHVVTANGKMTIHGVEKEVTLKGKLTIVGGEIRMESEFTVLLKDYDIKIPSLVVKNIAGEIRVNIDITYTPFEKK